MRIEKCDRCKQEIEGERVAFGLVNLNEKLKESESDSAWSMFRLGSDYKEYKFDLCVNCANDLLHWAQHIENDLKVDDAKKINKT